MNFDIEAAKQEGYSDAEIADYLAQEQQFDIAGARAEGYTDEELLQHLQGSQAQSADQAVAAAAPITSGFLMGLKDPITAGAQLLPRAGEFITSLGYQAPNAVSDWFASEAKRVDDIARAEEQGYQASRRAEGDTGFDTSRLAGNIINPANVVPGALARGGAVMKSVTTGATAGAMQPVTGGEDSFVSQKLSQTATGAVLGPAFEGTLKGLGKLASIVRSPTEAGREKTLRAYLNSAIPENERAAVISALQDAKEFVTGSRPTAAEVLSDIPSAAQLGAIQKKLASDPVVGAQFKAQQEANRQARQTLIDSIAKSDAERLAVEEARDGVFKNIGAKALDQANTARQALTEVQSVVNTKFLNLTKSQQLEKQIPTGWSAFATSGKPKVDAAAKQTYSEQMKKFQMDSLAQNGYFPLMAENIVAPINKMLKTELGDESRAILNGIREDILSRADKDGIVNSFDLYENVRKVLNQKAAVYLKQGEQAFQGGLPQAAAKTVGNIKKALDLSINRTTGGAWGKYLGNYAMYSKQLDRMAVGEALSKKLNTALDAERATVFAQAVEDAGTLIKKSTGLPRYSSVDQILKPAEMNKVKAVMADLERKVKAEGLASGLRTAEVGGEAALPNFLSRPVAATNIFLKFLTSGNNAKIIEMAAPLFQDPKALAAFIQNVPEPNLVMKLLAHVSPNTQRAMLQAIAIRSVENSTYQPNTYRVDVEVSRDQLNENARRMGAQ